MNEHQLNYTELQLAIKAALIEMGTAIDPSPDVLLVAEQQQFLLYVQYRESAEAPVTLADTHLISKYLTRAEADHSDGGEDTDDTDGEDTDDGGDAGVGSEEPPEADELTDAVDNSNSAPESGDINAEVDQETGVTSDEVQPEGAPKDDDVEPEPKSGGASETPDEEPKKPEESAAEDGGVNSADTKEGD